MSHRPAYLEADPLGLGVPPPSNGQRSRPVASDQYPADMRGDAWEGDRRADQAPPPPAAVKCLPRTYSIGELLDTYRELREPVIDGLLRAHPPHPPYACAHATGAGHDPA